jgi:hypothetical protein
LGVRLVSLTQPIDIDGAMGRMILAMMAGFAEMESEAIGARIRDNRRHLVMTEGKHYAAPPFGYTRVDGVMSEEKEAAAHVRWIFERVSAGAGLRSIAVELNTMGVAKRAGTPWTIAGVKVIIRNPAYLGKTTHGRKISRRTSKGHLIRSIVDRGKYLEVDGQHPAIIDEATWESANAILDRGKGVASRTAGAMGKYPWYSVLRCCECGGRMGIHKSNGYHRFECARRSQGGSIACPNGPGVSAILLDTLLVPALASRLAQDMRASSSKAKGGKGGRQGSSIAKLEGAIARESDLYRAGAIGIDELTKRVVAIKAKMEALGKPPAAIFDIPAIEDFGALWGSLPTEGRSGLVRELLSTVTVERERLIVAWSLRYQAHLGEGFEVPRPARKRRDDRLF